VAAEGKGGLEAEKTEPMDEGRLDLDPGELLNEFKSGVWSLKSGAGWEAILVAWDAREAAANALPLAKAAHLFIFGFRSRLQTPDCRREAAM